MARLLLAALGALLLLPSAALGAPQFESVTVRVENPPPFFNAHTLIVEVRESGLEPFEQILYVSHTSVALTLGCENKGGNVPRAAKYRRLRAESSVAGDRRTADANGVVQTEVEVTNENDVPLSPCPRSMPLVPVRVFWDTLLEDQTNGVSYDVPAFTHSFTHSFR